MIGAGSDDVSGGTSGGLASFRSVSKVEVGSRGASFISTSLGTSGRAAFVGASDGVGTVADCTGFGGGGMTVSGARKSDRGPFCIPGEFAWCGGDSTELGGVGAFSDRARFGLPSSERCSILWVYDCLFLFLPASCLL